MVATTVVMPDSCTFSCTGVVLVKAMLPVPVLLMSACLMAPERVPPSTLHHRKMQ